MHKVIVSIGALALTLAAGVASAQVYYPSYSAAACPVVSINLSIGSRGTDVTNLQRYLVAQNYPGGGSWMITGYFGQATAAAVRNYQSQHGLAVSGMVDSATRASLASCGSYSQNLPSYTTYPTYPWQSTYPTYPSYPTYPAYPTYPGINQPIISSLSLNAAAQGTQVTVYGSNFQYGATLVRIGGTNVAASLMSGGNAVTFTVPNITPGSYQITVSNSYSSSNALSFTVLPSSPCASYPFGGSCGCGFGTTCSSGPISVSFLSPAQGAVGTSVTIYGSGFSTTDNTVRFGQGIISNLRSFDGTSLTFTVPSELTGYGSSMVFLTTYYVSVTNSYGQTSNALPFTVTSLGSSGAPTITNLSGPTTLAVNTAGSWTFTLHNQNNSYTSVTVNWGDGSTYSTQNVYSQGIQTLSFSRTYAASGTYTIVVTATNQSGQTSTATTTVQITGTSGAISLGYASPGSGRVGTQVMLVGSGFSALDNTVRFGVGGTQHVPSQNGTTIYYTIPSHVSPCDVVSSGQICALYAQQVTPGTYTMQVTNQNGTTNTLNFTVTQ